MKLHSLHLQNFRGVIDRRVEFPKTGVVVLQGPNEVGKTSMMDALDLLLKEKDGAKKQIVRDAQPVNSDVAPVVTAEITAGRYRFVYKKQWLKAPATELQILQPQPESLTGSAAHDRVTQILTEEVDLDLFEALRVLQGGHAGAQAELRGNSALRAALEMASGTTLRVDDDAENLVAAIEAEYLKYFTARGNPTGAYRDAEKEVETARATVATAQAALEEAETQITKHQRLEAEQAEIAGRFKEASANLKADQAAFDSLAQHTEALTAAQENLKTTEQALSAAETAYRERQTLKELQQQRQTDAEEAAHEHEQAAEQLAGVKQRAAAQQEAIATYEGKRQELRERCAALEDSVANLQRRTQLQRETQRLTEIEAAEKRKAAAEAALVELKVDDDLLERIVKAEGEVRIASTILRDSAAQLTVTGLAAEEISVNGEGVEVGPQEPLKLAISEPVSLAIGQNIRLEATPAQSGAERIQELQKAKSQLSDALAAGGITDVAAARAANTEYRKNLRIKATAESQLDGLLGDEIPADLQARVALLKKQVAQGGPPTSEMDLSASETDETSLAEELSRAHESLAACEEKLAAAQEEGAILREAVASAQIAAARAESKGEAATAELHRANEDLTFAEKQVPTAALDEQLSNARSARDSAHDEVLKRQEKLEAQNPETVEMRLENSQLVVSRLEAEQKQLSEEIARSHGQLELIGSQGRQEALDEALSAYEAAQQAHDRIRRQARAAQLLHETVQRYQQQTWQRYVAPFQDRLTGLGRLVFGPEVYFEVSPNLEILSRTLAGQTVQYAALSTGAQEQIGILSRLACAQLVSNNGGVPVMIDDALGNSDPTRLEGLGAVLTQAGKDAQVIILTCTPERYRAVGSATVVRL